LYNFQGSRSVLAILFKVVLLNKLIKIIGNCFSFQHRCSRRTGEKRSCGKIVEMKANKKIEEQFSDKPIEDD